MLKFPPETAATVTFADRGENEYSMQIEGSKTSRFTSVADLLELKKAYGEAADYYPLTVDVEGIESEEAGVLVLRGYAKNEADQLMHEVEYMKRNGFVDTKSFSFGEVRNKHARHNNVMSWRRQAPDFANRKGTIVSFEDYEAFRGLHKRVHSDLKQPPEQKLVGELNYYFDVKTCGIGFHGDKERDLVAGLSLGQATSQQVLKFVPYLQVKALREPTEIRLAHGDLYIMSHKAIGSDCAKKNIVCWRHARGAPSCKYSVVHPKHKTRGISKPKVTKAAAAKKAA